MESRTLEITLQYARDLNKVNLITKMDVYAVVSISDGGGEKQKMKTTVDHEGDANPTWNFPVKLMVDEEALQKNLLTLDFKLICERALGDKEVGEVNVPIKELFDSPAKGDGKQFVSYQVRKPSGKPKGQLTFSYLFSEKTAALKPYSSDNPLSYPPPVAAYPAGSSSPYPPPPHQGVYPPPASYPAATSSEGNGHYPLPHPPSGPPHSGPGAYPPPPLAGYGYTPPPQSGYGYPMQPGYGYPTQPEYGYPPQPGFGYPPHPGYGYPPHPGYGYPAAHQPAKKNNLGLGLGAGLLGGAIGGLLVGDMISDAVDFDIGDGF